MALKKERSSNKSKGLCKWVINEDLTIYSIDELKEGLSKELDSYKDFKLNLGDVEEIDSSGIQLLLALKAELLKQEKTLTLTAVSDSVSNLMGVYGLGESFSQESAS